MSPQTKPSLMAIEQEVEIQAREWQRQQLQKRLQQMADEQGAVCPKTGAALQSAYYETVTLDTCAGTVTFRAHYGRHPQTRQWQHPIRLLWGLNPRQRLSPHLQDRVSSDLKMKGYTAWNIARFKSLNLSDFPWAGAGGSPGPPPARGADSAGGFRPPRSSSIPSLIVARVGTSTFFPVDTDAPVPGH